MTKHNTLLRLAKMIATAGLLAFAAASAFAGDLGPTVDDFSNETANSLGINRQFFDDSTGGGQTTTEYSVSQGILRASGDIVPPRGQPGWASAVLLLDPMGEPQDASQYDGIRLVIRVHEGNLAVSANSTEVTNFDYHAAPVVVPADGNFHTIEVSFSDMRRACSVGADRTESRDARKHQPGRRRHAARQLPLRPQRSQLLRQRRLSSAAPARYAQTIPYRDDP